MPVRKTAARCASWYSARFGDRPRRPRAAGRQFSAWPRTNLSWPSCSASRAVRSRIEATRRRSRGEALVPRLAHPRTFAAGRRGGMAGSARTRAARSSRERRPRLARRCCWPNFPTATPTPLSPWGIRLPPDSTLDDHPAFAIGPRRGAGRGQPADRSRLRARRRRAASSTFARERAARRWRSRRPRREREILATDSNRARLSKLAPRAERAGATIETRLLNPPNELARSRRLARPPPISSSSTRPARAAGPGGAIPEGRWRLTPERLDRLVGVQERLLDIAAEMVRPGGRLVYAVCSLLSREGAGQIDRFLSRHSSWIMEETPIAAGRLDGAGRLLTPGHDGTDGFFVARLRRPC